MQRNISIIVAIAENGAIGKNNDLLWHISDDLKRFKKMTSGYTVIMGRNTYLSLPKRPLPNRRNVVISDIPGEAFDGCIMAGSIEEAMNLADPAGENFIIGGAMVYKQFMPMANKLYLTRVHKSFDADAFYPEIDFSNWQLTEREDYNAGEKCEFAFSYLTYIRKK